MATATATKKAPAKRAAPKKAKATVKPKVVATPTPASTVASSDTNEQIIERGLKFVNELNKYGIPCSISKRGPAGKDIFMISKGQGIPGNLILWPGASTVDITIPAGDKKLRQVILLVKEAKRTIVRKSVVQASASPYETRGRWNEDIGMYDPSIPGTAASIAKHIDQDRDTQLGQFGINIPSTGKFAKTKVVVRKPETTVRNGREDTIVRADVTMTVNIPATEICFLIGLDEKSLFISCLPKTVDSIEKAHAALRPKGLRANSVRHGEWFFTPPTKAENDLINALSSTSSITQWFIDSWQTRRSAVNRSLDTLQGGKRRVPLETSSSHTVDQLIEVNKTLFARGTVRDTRMGHHGPIVLGDQKTWYRVTRNLEITQPTASMDQPRSAFRNSRGWD